MHTLSGLKILKPLKLFQQLVLMSLAALLLQLEVQPVLLEKLLLW